MNESLFVFLVPEVRHWSFIPVLAEDHVFQVAEKATHLKEEAFAFLVNDAEAFVKFLSGGDGNFVDFGTIDSDFAWFLHGKFKEF